MVRHREGQLDGGVLRPAELRGRGLVDQAQGARLLVATQAAGKVVHYLRQPDVGGISGARYGIRLELLCLLLLLGLLQRWWRRMGGGPCPLLLARLLLLHGQQPQEQQQAQQLQPDAVPGAADPSHVWLPEVVHHFARCLGGNEQACTLRLVNKATAAQFRGPQHTAVQLSLPVPHHAFVKRWGGPDATRCLNVRQRQQLPRLTARSGSIPNLEVLLGRDDLTSPLAAAVLAAAAGAGQLEVCRWLRQRGCPMDARTTRLRAARGGHGAVCEWLHDEVGPPADVWAASAAAARGGHVGLMDWLLARTEGAQGFKIWRLLAAAAAGCGLPTLQRLFRTYLDSRGGRLPEYEQRDIVQAAAGSPTADWRGKVEWLEGRGFPRTDSACMEAAQRVGGRERLEWLQQRGYPLTTGVVQSMASEFGDEDVLEFLVAQGVVPVEELAPTAYYAARGGHLAALKVVHAHGAPVGGGTLAAAAESGHLPVVAWLVETLGVPVALLTAGVFARAAASGNAELLVWLHERGCPWDASVFAAAAGSGSEEQLEWLAERGCPMRGDGEPYRRASINKDLAMHRCLLRLGCPVGPVAATPVTPWPPAGPHQPMEQQQPGKQQRTKSPAHSSPPSPQQPQQQQQAEQVQTDAVPDATDPPHVWLPEVVHHFARCLGGNEQACTLRLVNKATAAQFRGPQHTAVQLSLPVPHHAFVKRWGGPDATRCLNVRQRQQLPRLTARSGSIPNLEVLLGRDDLTSPLAAAVLAAAAGAGQLEVCRWLRQRGCPMDARTTRLRAARGGHGAVCEWLHDEVGPPADVWAASAAAARGGHVGLMDWLLARTEGAQGFKIWRLLAAAAAGCGLPTLQRLFRTYLDSRGGRLPEYEQRDIVQAAAGSPTADWRGKVEWLEGRGFPRTDSACMEAAQRVGGRERLEWLQQRGYPLTTGVVQSMASEFGDEDVLEFLVAQGVVPVEELAPTAYYAARGGHLAALKVVHAHGAPVGGGTLAAAAESGHLPVVAWLVETLGVPVALLTAGVFARAAASGNAELLVWLHERGCPWDASVFAAAAGSGSEEQLEWLAERGCPMRPLAHAPLRAAALHVADLACTPDAADPARVWLPEVVHHFARCLGGNEQACTLRLVSRATAAQFHGPQHTAVRLSLPVPHHAFMWRWGGPDATRSLTVWQRQQLPRLTARSGSIPNLEALLGRDDLTSPLAAAVLRAAAGAGQVERLFHTYLDSRGGRLPEYGQSDIVTAAAGSPTADWPSKVEWLEGRGCPRTGSACMEAARRVDGRERLDWLQQRGYPLTTGVAYSMVAEFGGADALEFLLAQGGVPVERLAATAFYAVRGGHLAALKVVHAHGVPVDGRTLAAAAESGHLPVVAWLVGTLGATGALLTADVFARAAASGNAELLGWLHERGCPWDATVFAAAAGSGSKEQLEWLAERGCPMGVGGMEEYPSASVLRTQPTWQSRSLMRLSRTTAAQFRGPPQHTAVRLSLPVPNHAFVRRWAGPNAARSLTLRQRQQLPCLTARSGSIPNLEVLLTRDDLTNPLAAEVFEAAAGAGQLEVCRWLRQRGCPLGDTTWQAAAGGGHRAVCEWLHNEGGPPADAWAASAAAARGGHVELMDWILERSAAGAQEGNVWSLLAAAAAGCDLPTLQRLFHTYLDSRGAELSILQQREVVADAKGSSTADSQDKVEWLRGRGFPQACGSCRVGAQWVVSREQLEWLVERLGADVVLKTEMFARAAETGDVPLLAWLHERGCPWDASVFVAAAAFGSEEQLEWLAEHGCPMGDDGEPYRRAAANKDLAMHRCLLRLGCPVGPGV
ncbi:hypothetical protein TSOC_011868 [Tetrabaena socialis]|uniref:Ankyrin repeat domain-containing protein n=1 Tax=Tetrabaena socialis TaxID=47790 RepID=A0A2J7ZPI6_9CHLO|nr:hypothetical protein TSOC_011868 [Tetrabaena socialis]|eukprot:PNH02176.1 hypothetical protein TSOC_011868 [Tetrabaena socialis]